MPLRFEDNINLQKLELQNARIQNLGSAPSSPVTGQIYYDTSTSPGKLYYWNGSAWVNTAGGVTSVSATGPLQNTGTASDPVIALKTGSGAGATNGVSNTHIAADAAIALSKLATDPLARANHTGTQLAATVSDFDTQVRTSRLDQMAAPTSSVGFNSQKITALGTPTSATDAATKAYVDSAAAGIDWKASVRAASTANVTIASALINGLVMDGVTLATGDRVLLKAQTAPAENGIYVVVASGAASRATDADASVEVTSGLAAFVEEGTTNAATAWVLTTTGAITLGTTGLTFTQFSGLGQVVSGAGLTKTGNTLDIGAGTGITVNADTIQISPSYVGQTSITTLGTITTGTWTGTTIAVLNGGTGATTAASARTNLGAAGKYTALIGDGSTTAISITQATHGLAANDSLVVSVTDNSTGDVVYPSVVIAPGTGNITLTFATAPATNSRRITVVG